MSNPKTVHYTHQLHLALCRGAWAESRPGKAPNGVALSWDELLRKFRKHCRGHEDLCTVALQTQTLSLLLLKTTDSQRTSSLSASALDGSWDPQDGSLALGDECILQEEWKEEAQSGLLALEPTSEKHLYRESLHLTRAYFSFSLSNPRECLATTSQIDFESAVPSLPVPSTISSASNSFLSAYSTSPNGTIGSASIETALYRSGSIAGSIGSVGLLKLDSEMGEGLVWWVTERVRGKCLEGMCYEMFGDLPAALNAYESAVPFLDRLTVARLNTTTDRAKLEAFNRHRELWRWVERLLRRAVIVASKIRPVEDTIRLLRINEIYSNQWPNSFRPSNRGIVYTLYLRALCIAPPAITLPGSKGSSARTQRLSETKRVAEEYRSVLNASTHFPRAGEINTKALDLVDLCVASWERGGYNESLEETGWVIEILWWATRLTFHSHRVMRHLTRLLVTTGEYEEAKRTFKLYIQLVTQARQTGVTSQETMPSVTELATDADDDKTFVETLVFGSRLLCRFEANEEDIKEAEKVAKMASDIMGSPSLANDRVLKATVERLLGIVSIQLAIRESDTNSRPKHQTSALTHLINSSELNTTSACTSYHLAVAQSFTRDVEAAILSAKHAVEQDPKEIRAWHLLGLLLTAKEDWQGAQAVLELGIESAEEDDAEPQNAKTNGHIEAVSGEKPNGVISQDFAEGVSSPERPLDTSQSLHILTNGKVESTPSLIPPTTTHLPSSSTLLLSSPDIIPPSTAERFEQSIQLRLTQLAIVELVDGSESANTKWPVLFAFFSDHCPSGPSLASRGQSIEVPPSDSVHTGDLTLSPVPTDASVPHMGVLIPPSPKLSPINAPMMEEKSHSKRLSERLMKGQRQIHSFGKKIAKGHVGHRLLRSSSVPNLHAVLGPSRAYQASSIHSRQRVSPVGSFYRGSGGEDFRSYSPPPPPPQPPEPRSRRTPRERRLLCDLWLTSAATFRRMGKHQQARGAIMEAEVLDEDNPNVWVQLGLYFAALGNKDLAIESFHKALVIDPDHIPATVHLAQQHLTPYPLPNSPIPQSIVDLAAGMLNNLTQKSGWDVPEAWYFLAKACRLQGRTERERECLVYALRLEESRCVRSIGAAVPSCL